MKSLKNRLLNEGFYQNAGGIAHPATKADLEHEIKIRLDRGQYNLNDIDTSRITDMSYLFHGSGYDLSRLDVSEWDVSNVKDMGSMFAFCREFNSDLSRWDVSKVEDMSSMFRSCIKFNCDLSKWNVSKVKDMYGMFAFCENFNCDLSKWNVSNVQATMEMFVGCTNFNCNLSKWNVKKVKNMYYMFDDSSMKKKPRWYKG